MPEPGTKTVTTVEHFDADGNLLDTTVSTVEVTELTKATDTGKTLD